MPLSVEYADLSLAQQVLERQGTHVQNMHSFLDEWGHIVTGGVAPVAVYKTGYGLLLMAFNGLNEIAVQAGLGVLKLLENAHTGTANHMGRTIDAYVSADEQIHAALSAATQALGGSVLPFNDPRSSLPTLGAAEQRASQWYGGADPNVFAQMGQDIDAFRNYVTGLSDRVVQRGEKALSANRSISEAHDASSYLVTPEAPESEMENLRWKAGPVLGGVDWLIEKLTGVSVLNDIIFKYTVGDWRVIHRARTAWSEIGDALVAVGQNDSEILPALSEWTGRGSEAANVFIAALSWGTTSLEGAAGVMSTVLLGIQLLVKKAANEIGELLVDLQIACLELLGDAGVPVAGWVKAAFDIAKDAWKFIQMVMSIYDIINMVFDIMESLVEAKDKLIEVRFTIANLAEAAVRGAAARV